MASVFGFFGLRRTQSKAAARSRIVGAAPRYRPMLEALEDRTVMSAPATLHTAAPALSAITIPGVTAQQLGTSLLPITINNIANVAGTLVANASVAGQSLQLPLNLSATQNGTTPILNLTIQPIHLNVLGLTVDTSEIRLQITAQSGGLLGTLLTDVSNLLNGSITPTQLTGLTTNLTKLLNSTLATLTSPATAATGASVTSTGTTNILHLSVGPLNLHLLGLNVVLDNGNGGPVTIDIGAQTGPGNLLGNLLGNLSNLLGSNANLRAITNALGRVAGQITALLKQPTLLPITINSIGLANGGLVANALLGGLPFQIPLTLTGATSGAASPQAQSSTTILNLTLQPIHLDLLGLTVDTSEIHLQITAQTGPGNLLGNLLSDIANALNGGTSLSDILAGLTSTQLTTLTTSLSNLITEVFGALTSPLNVAHHTSVTTNGSTIILHLSVGPLNLNLLGLGVVLDNGSGGPVTVDIGAQTGPGQLLGNLLASLSNLLNHRPALGAITNLLNQIAGKLASLINQPSLLPIQINSIGVANGGLVANALLGSLPFQIPLGLTAGTSGTASPQAQSSTTILNLTLQPIHLDLLGLTVDTSEIHLQITAQSGVGNVLGDLLSSIANALNGGTSLANELASLTSAQLTTLTTGLTTLLNEALGALTAPINAAAGVSTTASNGTEILHLSVGPLNLNLLGLVVVLDNGSGGPVTIDISAQTGPGQLLGNLLSNLTGLLDSGAGLAAITNTLGQIAGALTGLLNQPTLLPALVNNVAVASGALVANGSLAGTPFQLQMGLTADPPAQGSSTQILNLTLQPIHLNLLGLTVDTSEIRLQITAQSGTGNLLGNLLNSIGSQLNSGKSLSDILSGLTPDQLTTLTTGLTNLISEALATLLNPVTAAAGISTTASRTTQILHLSVGPLNLNLLGLNVVLDNGMGGPVTVDIGAQTGPGNLLGNLLADLAGLLDNGSPLGAIVNSLDRIGNNIATLV